MRLTLALALLTATLGLASPASEQEPPQVPAFAPVPVAAEARDDVSESESGSGPTKRACSHNGCRCLKGAPQGQYCGNCVKVATGEWVITRKRNLHHVYECSPGGDCCDYGAAGDYGTSHARCGA
ncbi:hypothetical protein MYCTH_2113983 [Thermothelomyces thermophilus ATCC 42464]|uniref:Uncharacterized protein n=1 Tax=Thermothelomyces thermophilus (strain ATCC 42464 / BCRC 31852 / DSM 1799) TaxID=573729 RepID=G2QNV0_THET4|nr:uncharacterized protein MYCTH_2113983 [Thermothelomyces thermophilus ATCC 42464]AEO62126.1 hypothetical protein MYCTH_2113983 [Thermothelomyces thermophilus ATCC 42464]